MKYTSAYDILLSHCWQGPASKFLQECHYQSLMTSYSHQLSAVEFYWCFSPTLRTPTKYTFQVNRQSGCRGLIRSTKFVISNYDWQTMNGSIGRRGAGSIFYARNVIGRGDTPLASPRVYVEWDLHVCSERCGGNIGTSWNLTCARNLVGAASELDVCEYMDRCCSDWCLNINVYKERASYLHTFWDTVDESLTRTEPQLPRDWEISQGHLPTNVWNDAETITGSYRRGFTALVIKQENCSSLWPTTFQQHTIYCETAVQDVS